MEDPFCYLNYNIMICSGIYEKNIHIDETNYINFYEEIIKFSLMLKNYNYEYIIVTNQSGIGRGFSTVDNLFKINEIALKQFLVVS